MADSILHVLQLNVGYPLFWLRQASKTWYLQCGKFTYYGEGSLSGLGPAHVRVDRSSIISNRNHLVPALLTISRVEFPLQVGSRLGRIEERLNFCEARPSGSISMHSPFE